MQSSDLDPHLGREARRTVEPDHLAVEVRVADDRLGEQRVLLGSPEPSREEDVLEQRLLAWGENTRGVRIAPGAIAHTRTPIGARSRAIGRIIETIAPLAAAYGTIVTWPSKALIDAVCTITPRWPSSSASLAAKAAADNRARLNGPHTCSSRFASSVSFGIGERSRATRRPLGMTTPVALTTMEKTPRECAAVMASPTASSSLLSPVTAATRSPNSPGELGSPLRVGIEHDDSDALRREAANRRAPEPAGTAGDDRRSPVELHQRASWISATIAAGVSGRRVISTPNGASASPIAFTTAGGAPMAPPSPTPL